MSKNVTADIFITPNEVIELYAAIISISTVYEIEVQSISAKYLVEGFLKIVIAVYSAEALYFLGTRQCFFERNPTICQRVLQNTKTATA